MTMAAMLLLLNYNPRTIGGFESLASCRAAAPMVLAFYKRERNTNSRAECIELPK